MRSYLNYCGSPWRLLIALAACFSTIGAAHAQSIFLYPIATELPEQTSAEPYWLGIGCSEVDAALRSHLNLEGHGVLVSVIVPDSPASKAGLQLHDVLIEANGKSLDSIDEVTRVVNDTGGASLKLVVIRKAKRLPVTIQPVKRPAKFPRQPNNVDADLPAHVQQWLQWVEPSTGKRRVGVFFNPGVIMPPEEMPAIDLPDDVSVEMIKRGKQPTAIVVRRGDQTYQVTPATLDELPKDLQEHVHRLLDGQMMWRLLRGAQPGLQSKPAPDQNAGEADEDHSALENRLQSLQREMESLHQAIDRMHAEKQNE